MNLPGLCIIGAQKSGTSTLHVCLAEHPAIQSPIDPDSGQPIKEIEFFGKNWERGVDWYRSHFTDVPGLHIDSTPNYLCNIAAHGRMRHVIPDARLIVTLRDPVDRAFSQFNHYSQSIEKSRDWDWRCPGESFAANIRAEVNEPHHPWFGLIGRGLYCQQLEHLYKCFPQERVRIVVMEQWACEPDDCFQNLLDFAGVPRQPLPRKAVHMRPYTVGPMAEEAEELLTKIYRPHNERLYDLLGGRIDEWRR